MSYLLSNDGDKTTFVFFKRFKYNLKMAFFCCNFDNVIGVNFPESYS